MKGRRANITLLIVSIVLVILLFMGVFDTEIVLLLYAIIFAGLGVLSKGFKGK